MPRSESDSIGSPVHRLLIHGSVEPPEILLPGRDQNILRSNLIPAKDLNDFSSLLSTFPIKERPYAKIDIRELPPQFAAIPKVQPQVSVAQEVQPEPKKLTVSLFVVSADSMADPQEIIRQLDRGKQRVDQYEKLSKFVALCRNVLERGGTPRFTFWYEHDGLQVPAAFEIEPEDIPKFERIVETFYENELQQDPLTDTLAQGVQERMVSDEQAMIAKAEEIIFESQRKQQQVEVTHTEVTIKAGQNKITEESKKGDPQKVQKEKSEKSFMPVLRSVIISLRFLSARVLRNMADKIAPKDFLDAAEIVKAVDNFLRQDCPNKEAAAFFEEVWNRPF